MITLCYKGHLRHLTGKTQETCSAATFNQVLRFIRTTYGEAAYREAKASHIHINDHPLHQHLLRPTILHDGDTITFLPVCGGG